MINNVSFGQKMGIYDRPNVDAPQAYQRPQAAPQQPEVAPKKKHTAAKVIGGLAVLAAVVAGLAYGAKNGKFDPAYIADLTKSFKDSKYVSWAKPAAKTVLNGMKTAGDYINQGIAWVGDKCKPVIDYFSRNKNVAEEIVEEAV